MQECVIAGDVGRDDLHQVITLAGGAVAFDDGGALEHGLLEGFHHVFYVAREVHLRQYAVAQADPVAVELGGVALDDAALLEGLEAFPGGCGGEADAPGQVLYGKAAVFLKRFEDFYRVRIWRKIVLHCCYSANGRS